MNPASTTPFSVRDLSLPVRLTLAAFMVSVGIGYFSALINLHFQEASPGELLPTEADVVKSYCGDCKISQLDRLLVAHPSLPFNGQGSMRSAFTKQRSSGWEKSRKVAAKAEKLDLDNPVQSKKADEIVQLGRDGERLSLVAWVREGGPKQAYEEDSYTRKSDLLAKHPITAEMVNDDGTVKIKSILEKRCVRCHSESVGGSGSQYPLDNYDEVALYLKSDTATGKSLPKLALSTHVHLLGFSVLYGMTGLIFALTSYPWIIRLPIAPLALVAQVVDISFWWLARLPEDQGVLFAKLIPVTGGIVAVSLGLQIVLTLFNLFRVFGKIVLVALIAAAGYGAYVAKEKIVDPYLNEEKKQMLVPGERM